MHSLGKNYSWLLGNLSLNCEVHLYTDILKIYIYKNICVELHVQDFYPHVGMNNI